MITITAAFLLAASSSDDLETTPRVDVVEFNHLESGLDQIILWRFTADGEHVAEWMRAKDVEHIDGIVTWRSCNPVRLYIARCKIFRETHTIRDPEVDDRKKLPQELRVPYFD